MNITEGRTVLAVRDGDDHHLYVYGEGVLIGDRLMPGTPEEVPSGDRDAIMVVLAEDDADPIAEHRLLRWYDEWVRSGGQVTRTREQIIEGLQADRARPVEDRVQEMYRESRMNPCIYLDSGDIIYGYQCWWGDPERFRKRYPTHVQVLVPVPEGNGRWR